MNSDHLRFQMLALIAQKAEPILNLFIERQWCSKRHKKLERLDARGEISFSEAGSKSAIDNQGRTEDETTANLWLFLSTRDTTTIFWSVEPFKKYQFPFQRNACSQKPLFFIFSKTFTRSLKTESGHACPTPRRECFDT
jgi:hypothetical protein